MDNINERYHVLDDLTSGRELIRGLLVEDAYRANTKMMLYLVDEELLNPQIYQRLIQVFPYFRKFNKGFYLRPISIDRVWQVDFDKELDNYLFYTAEYKENVEYFSDWIRDKSVDDIVSAIYQLLRGYNESLLAGVHYNSFRFSDIVVVNEEGESRFYHRDLISTELPHMLHSEDADRRFLHSISFSNSGGEVNFKKFSAMILSMMERKSEVSFEDLDSRLSSYRSRIDFARRTENMDTHLRLLDFIDKVYYDYFDSDYSNFSQVFSYFSRAFGKDTRVFLGDDKPHIEAKVPIIGRREELIEINHLIYSDDRTDNVCLVMGHEGVGKTRFLKEIHFRTKLQGSVSFLTYSKNFTRGTNVDLINQLTDVIERISVRERRKDNYKKLSGLRNKIQSLKVSGGNFYQLAHEIFSFLANYTRKGEIVFLIDDFGKSNAETVEFVLGLLQDKLISRNLVLVCAIEDNDLFNNKDLSRFIRTIKQSGDIREFEFENLNQRYYKIFMHTLLTNVYEDRELYDFIWDKTRGNPAGIMDFISKSILKGNLYIDQFTGKYYFSSYLKKDEDSLRISSSFLYFNLLREMEEIILFAISCVGGEIEIKKLCEILAMEERVVYEHTAKLKDYSLISVRNEGLRNYYRVFSEEIREMSINSIDKEKKTLMHKKILRNLEAISEEGLIESIYQYEQLDDIDKAIENIEKLLKYYNDKNYQQAVLCYEKAWNLIDDSNPTKKLEFVLGEIDLFIMYSRLEPEQIDGLFERSRYLYDMVTKPGMKEEYLLRLSKILYFQYDFSLKQRDAIRDYRNIPLEERTRNYDDILSYMRANYYATKGQKHQAVSIYIELISKYEDASNLYKPNEELMGDVYRFYALLREEERIEHSAEHQALIGLFIQSIQCCSKVSDYRGAYASALNVASVYKDKKFEYDKSIELLLELLVVVQEGGSSGFEIRIFSELAEAYNLAGKSEKALEYLFIAQRRIDFFGLPWEKPKIYEMILQIYLNLGQYIEFENFYNEHIFDLNKVKEDMDKQLFNDAMSDFYFYIGNFGGATHQIYQSILLANPHVKDPRDDERLLIYEIYASILEKNINMIKISNYLDFIIEKFPSQFLHHEYIKKICTLVLIYRNSLKHEELKIVIEKLSDFLENPMTDLLQSFNYFFNVLLYEDNSERRLLFLQKALMKERPISYNIELSQGSYRYEMKNSIRNHPIYALIQLEIAKILFSYNHKTHAMSQLNDALVETLNMLRHVPSQHKVSFVNTYGLHELFYYYGKNILTEKNILNRELDSFMESKEIFNFIESVECDVAGDEKFLDTIIDLKLNQYGFPQKSEDLTKLFDNRRDKNISLLLKFFLVKLLAAQAYILQGAGDGSYQIFAFCDSRSMVSSSNIKSESGNMINPEILMKVIKRHQVTVLKGAGIIPEHPKIHNLISYPIDVDFGRRKDIDYCYMVFVSDSQMNRFDELANNYQYIEGVLMMNLLSGYFLKTRVSQDPLTGALIRKYLDEELERFQKFINIGNKGALIMIDLDKFKNINDTYGHQVGDIVLSNVARAISNRLKDISPLGRYGGEEFVAVLPDVDEETAFSIAEGIRHEVYGIRFSYYNELTVTVSIGVAVFEGGEDISVKEMVERADKALYQAKFEGRNRSVIYNAEIGENQTKVSPLYGITVGNEIRDQRIFDTLIEMSLLKISNISFEKMVLDIVNNTISIMEADEGGMVIERNGKFAFYSKPEAEDLLIYTPLINPEEYLMIKEEEEVRFTEWNQNEERDPITKMPLWRSFIGVALKKNEQVFGAIYIRALFLEKAFTDEDIRLMEKVSQIVAMLL